MTFIVGKRYRVSYTSGGVTRSFTGKLIALKPRPLESSLLTFKTKDGPRMLPEGFVERAARVKRGAA